MPVFQPELRECTPRTMFVFQSCDFCLEKLLRTRRGSSPRPHDSESSRANHATTSKDQFASNKFAQRHNESASIRTRIAENSSGTLQIPRESMEAIYANIPMLAPRACIRMLPLEAYILYKLAVCRNYKRDA